MMSDLLTAMPPGFVMMLLALPIIWVPHHARQLVMLAAIAMSTSSITVLLNAMRVARKAKP